MPDAGAAVPGPDAAVPDAGTTVQADPLPAYPTDRLHSPITPAIARNIQRIAMGGGDAVADDVFMKVGDSITVSGSFLNCFGGSSVDLGDHAALQATLDRFKAGHAGGTNPFQRSSIAAGVGWMATRVLASPPPLDAEMAALHPRYAVIMYGTNDAANRALARFVPAMLDIVDQVSAAGIVPLLSTIPDNLDNAATDLEVPVYNAAIRGIAQGRGVPLMDLWQVLAPLPHRGLSSDGIHPSTYSGGSCKLTSAGLQSGYTARNLLVLEELDRVRAIVEGDPAPDRPATRPAVLGAGSEHDPFRIESFPFTQIADTRRQGQSALASYSGCAATQNESGPEHVYELHLDAPARVRVFVFDRGDTDVDVHVLSGAVLPDACVGRNDQKLDLQLAAGTHYVVVDSFVPADGVARSGEYMLLVMKD